MTVEEILADLGVTVDPAKAANVTRWNTTLATSQSEATQKLADAQKSLQDAQALQRVIDDNIRTAGLTETNIAQLQANNAAMAAALESIKKQGFTGITIPEMPNPAANTKNPMDELSNLINKGFTQMGQTLNEMNRYQRVFGQPLPDDPAMLADKAAAARMSVHDYVEQTYRVSDKEKQIAADATAKRESDLKAQGAKEWQDAHPSTAGHPELNGGMPSNYPTMPKPREATTVRDFAALPARQKIADAMTRATKDVSSRNVA